MCVYQLTEVIFLFSVLHSNRIEKWKPRTRVWVENCHPLAKKSEEWGNAACQSMNESGKKVEGKTCLCHASNEIARHHHKINVFIKRILQPLIWTQRFTLCIQCVKWFIAFVSRIDLIGGCDSGAMVMAMHAEGDSVYLLMRSEWWCCRSILIDSLVIFTIKSTQSMRTTSIFSRSVATLFKLLKYLFAHCWTMATVAVVAVVTVMVTMRWW